MFGLYEFFIFAVAILVAGSSLTYLLIRMVRLAVRSDYSLIAFFLGMFLSIGGAALFLPIGAIGILPATVYLVISQYLLISFLIQARRNRAAAILNYLNQAITLNFPMQEYLLAASRAERGKISARLELLAYRLGTDASIADALRKSAPEVHNREVTLVEQAERIGRVREALARLTVDTKSRALGTWSHADLVFGWYPVLLMLFASLMVVTFEIFLLPRFEKIWEDFDFAVPSLALWAIDMLKVVPRYVLFGSLIFVGFYLIRRISIFRSLTDSIYWRLPFIGRLDRDRSMADVCHIMSESIHMGRSIEMAMSACAALDVNLTLKRRLKNWHQNTQAGQLPGEAAAKAGLPRLFANILRHNVGQSLEQAMRFLYRYHSDAFSRSMAILRQLAGPLTAVLIGFVVLLLGLAVIFPLAALIASMTWQIPEIYL